MFEALQRLSSIYMTSIVPEEIETERLSLRQFRDEDWRDLHQCYSDENATKYTVGRCFTEGVVVK